MRTNKLQLARQRAGLTQMEVAIEAKISETSYQQIECGSQQPNLDTALLIARTLGSTVEELFGAAPFGIAAKKTYGFWHGLREKHPIAYEAVWWSVDLICIISIIISIVGIWRL